MARGCALPGWPRTPPCLTPAALAPFTPLQPRCVTRNQQQRGGGPAAHGSPHAGQPQRQRGAGPLRGHGSAPRQGKHAVHSGHVPKLGCVVVLC